MQQRHIKVHKGGIGTWVGPNPKSYSLLRNIRASAKLDSSLLIKNNSYIPKTIYKKKLENMLIQG